MHRARNSRQRRSLARHAAHGAVHSIRTHRSAQYCAATRSSFLALSVPCCWQLGCASPATAIAAPNGPNSRRENGSSRAREPRSGPACMSANGRRAALFAFAHRHFALETRACRASPRVVRSFVRVRVLFCVHFVHPQRYSKRAASPSCLFLHSARRV